MKTIYFILIICLIHLNLITVKYLPAQATPTEPKVIILEKNGSAVLQGAVIDKDSKLPLEGVNIIVKGSRIGTISRKDGTFKLSNLDAGKYMLKFEYIGYAGITLKDIQVSEGEVVNLDVIELKEKPLSLQEIVVTPGRYSIMGDETPGRLTLSSDDIKMMGWAEDVTRAVQRIPGISSNDFSAKFNIRGGDVDEVLVILDGMQIYNPFHQKDFAGGLFSTVDIETIDGVELITGGFSAEYGDRMSGVLNMRSKRAFAGKRETSVGVSLINARVFSMGTFNNNRTSWMISARRGYLDLLNNLMKNEFKLKPAYYDIYGKLESELNEKHRLSVHAFLANDSYTLDEKEYEPQKTVPNIDYVDTDYGNGYGWLTLKSVFSPNLIAQSMVYAGSLTKKRFWDRYDDDPVASFTTAQIYDDRYYQLFGFKQDWDYEMTKKVLFRMGMDFKTQKIKYDYSNNLLYEYVSTDDSLLTFTGAYDDERSNSGRHLSLYLAGRYQLLSPLVLETGLRYDNISHSDDQLWSPRISMVYSIGKATFLRAAWGRYYQSHRIDQLNIQFQEIEYQPAELSEHYILGMEHRIKNGMQFRVEGYYKYITNLMDSYYTFANIDEFFPESRTDLFRVEINDAISRGIEFYLKYDTGNKFSWWFSYVLSDVKEDYQDIHYPGIVTKKLGFQPRPWDQRHTLNLDLNYRPNTKWHFNMAWYIRSGWPYTSFEVKRKPRDNGTFAYYHEYGTFNASRYPAYHRMDVRINRYFNTSYGQLTAFLYVINLYNQENISSYDHDVLSESADSFKHEIEGETWFPIMPFIGVSLKF